MILKDLLEILSLIAFIEWVITFLGDENKIKKFNQGMLKINKIFNTKIFKISFGILLCAFVLAGLVYAFMVGSALINKNELYKGLFVFILMGTATLIFAFVNYSLIFNKTDNTEDK
jgi:hypothetical protein